MGSVKITISLPEEVAEQVRAAADKEHVSVSAWLSEAAEQWARVQAARELVHEYEAEHGAFTPEENALDAANCRLSLVRV
jgi:Arc/MetJ-type ribon-helix-helix transcriptional regulator